MKWTTVIWMLIGCIAAVATGWIYQYQATTSEAKAALEVPVDIDYYLSGVNYQAMDANGQLDYELETPYLQHYKYSDISRLEAPIINIYRYNKRWRLQASRAEIRHPSNTLKLTDSILLKQHTNTPMQLDAKIMHLEPGSDWLVGEQQVRLKTRNSRIRADKGVFDFKQGTYLLTNVHAIYDYENR